MSEQEFVPCGRQFYTEEHGGIICGYLGVISCPHCTRIAELEAELEAKLGEAWDGGYYAGVADWKNGQPDETGPIPNPYRLKADKPKERG